MTVRVEERLPLDFSEHLTVSEQPARRLQEAVEAAGTPLIGRMSHLHLDTEQVRWLLCTTRSRWSVVGACAQQLPAKLGPVWRRWRGLGFLRSCLSVSASVEGGVCVFASFGAKHLQCLKQTCLSPDVSLPLSWFSPQSLADSPLLLLLPCSSSSSSSLSFHPWSSLESTVCPAPV